MRYALLILASPHGRATSLNAARFTRAALARGHEVPRVFFLDAGVDAGIATAVTPQGELDVIAEWAGLAADYPLELVLCVSSALRRGVLDTTESVRHERIAPTMHPSFTIGGLGLLLEAIATADRVLTFGGGPA